MNNELVFKPELTPKQMLGLGVFDGAYFPEIPADLPKEWFTNAKLSNHGPDPKYNFYQIMASQSHAEWERKGWISPVDPLGWFQWYCRYYMGRRIPDEDTKQIKRWKMMRRHVVQVKKYCDAGDLSCRRKQRQALLHWAYDSRKI